MIIHIENDPKTFQCLIFPHQPVEMMKSLGKVMKVNNPLGTWMNETNLHVRFLRHLFIWMLHALLY